jgi:uncharacterized metal-binding protein YceD (DUF177 family)
MAADPVESDVAKAWPQPVGLSEAGRGPVSRTLVADSAARERIAKLLGLNALSALRADIQVKPWLDGVAISGPWTATVQQTCGVTLEPFETELEGELQIRAVPAGSPALTVSEDHEVELDPEADDPPDVILGDQVDLGAYVVEDLSLAIDPFPRKPGVTFEPVRTGAEISPFAVLAKLKSNLPDSE